MTPTLAAVLTSVALCVFAAFVGAVLIYFRSLNAQIVDIRISISELKTQVSPLWAKVQSQIASDLHHPHPRYFEMDKLLEQLEALTITDHDRERLKILLLERSTDMHEDITQEQREKAKLMIQVMDLVLVEAQQQQQQQQQHVEDQPVRLKNVIDDKQDKHT